jgi:uncharacterized membrane protein YphA (DoxX/SURF4 family)
MMVVRRIARPMVASMFVLGGIDALRHPEPKAPAAAKVGPDLAEAAPIDLPTDPTELVRINGAVQVVAGSLLAVGKLPRVSALALAGSLVPTTLAGHRFWEETDPQAKQQQQIHFFKNVSMLGGLLLAAVDTSGKPSLGWRARKAAKTAKKRLPIGE